jgi:hypothetical protein
MLEVPAVIAVAKPWDPELLLMAATAEEDEFHVAVLVKFWVLPSLNVPMAAN